MSKYLVTLKFLDRFQHELDDLRRQIAPRRDERIPAHLTLVPPFTSDQAESLLVRYLQVACQPFHSFFLMPHGIDRRFPKADILALAVAPGPYIGSIARQAAQLLKPLMETDGRIRVGTLLSRPFRPHITLARGTAFDRQEADELASRQLNNRPAQVDSLLLWQLEGERWQPLRHVPLPR